MQQKHLIPLALFCVLFLIYTIYFVKVINQVEKLEPNSIAKNIKRSMEEKIVKKKIPLVQEKKESPSKITEEKRKPGTMKKQAFVNNPWLNVRKDPSIGAAILEKIYLNDEVIVIGEPNILWSEVLTPSGKQGFVATRYLSETLPKKKETVKKTETPDLPVISEAFKIPIITYHHITDETEKYAKDLMLPVSNFLAQLDYLVANEFKTFTFFDLKDLQEENVKSVDKAVILTFDDGYDDAYLVAQYLNGKGLKGVFFIITGKIGTPGYLTWTQVKKMRSWGMEIGSHGVASADLTTSSEFYVKDELERSKKIIEEELGESIISFAYPAGKYNADVMKAAEKADYLFARTIISGSEYKKESFYKLPTLRIFFPAGANQFRVWLSS